MDTTRTLNFLLNFEGKNDEESAAILFMADVSSSMKGEPIRQAQAALSDLIHRTREQDQVAVMTFCDEIERIAAFSRYPEYIEEQIANMTARDAQTRLYDAVRKGVDWLREQETGLKVIVLLSDGQDCGSSNTNEDQCVELAKMNHARLYTIGYSADGPASPGMKVLERFASESGGRFFCAPSADRLQEVFAHAFAAAQEDLDLNIRKRVRRELREIDEKSEVWSRFISIDTCEGGQEWLDSPLDRDNPCLFLKTTARSRPTMFADFAAKFLATQSGATLLQERVRDVLLRQAREAAGGSGTGVNVFIVGRVNDLLTLSAAIETARQVREVRRLHAELFLSTLSVFGLFILHDEARWPDQDQKNIYSWLSELDRQQRGRITAPFDRVIFISSNNAHPANNPGGFVSLTDDRNGEMIVETLAALNASPAVVGEAAQPSRTIVDDHYFYLSTGEAALFVNRNQILRKSAMAYGADLLKGMYEIAPDHARADSRVKDFFRSQPIEAVRLKDSLLRVTDEQEDALQRLRFDVTEFWPFDEEKKKRYPGRQEYLAHLPYDVREHAEFVLAQKLSRFRAIVSENHSRTVTELSAAIESYTEAELWQSPQSHPVQAEQWIRSLHERVAKEHIDFRARKADELLGEKYFYFSFRDIEVRDQSPDVHQAYRDMVAQIEKTPLPEAIYSRYCFLGLISALAVDKAVSLIPAFLLNIGPLRLPMLLGILVLLLFALGGRLKHRLAERQLSFFIKYYAMAMQKKARDRAAEILKTHMNQTYAETLERIGERDQPDPDSEMGKLQALRSYLSSLRSEMMKPGERSEATSLFHISAFDRLAGEQGRDSRQVLERAPRIGYPTSAPLDWRNETRDLVTNGKNLFAEWRAIVAVAKERRLPEWERINRPRLSFKKSFFGHATDRFAKEVSERAQLHSLLAANNRPHNELVHRRLAELCYSPMYSDNATPGIFRFWSAEGGNADMLRDGKIFPRLDSPTWRYEPSSDPTHLRLFTMMNFELEDIPLFRNCKAVYDACADRTGLHLVQAAEASDAAATDIAERRQADESEL